MKRAMPPEAIVTTRRLTLRGLLDRDATAIVEGLGDIEVARWLSRVPFPYTLPEARRFLAWEREVRDAGEERVIALDREGLLIGVASLRGLGPDPVLGYWLARRHWGLGYMTEAVEAVVAVAFEVLGLEMIRSGVFEGNERSLAIQRRLGFVINGRSRVRNLALGRDLSHIDTCLTRARHQELLS